VNTSRAGRIGRPGQPKVIDVQTVSAYARLLHQDRAQAALALAVCLIAALFQTLAPPYTRPVADAMQYAGMAASLAEAMATDWGRVNEILGTFFGPVYPMFAGVLAFFDADLARALTCVSRDGAVCDLSGLTALFVVQAVLAAFTAFFVFLAARRLAGDACIAWLTLAIVLATKCFTHYAGLILTEIPTFFFVGLFAWMLARLLSDPVPARRDAVLAGAALAGAALTRASYVYLLYFMVPVIVLWWRFGRARAWTDAAAAAACFAAGAAAILAPWWIRNYVGFDLAGISGGYGPKVLIERLPYNLMTWREWAISLIYWLPDFGDNLATALFSEEQVRRLSWYHPDSFYMMGRGQFFLDVQAASGAQDNPLGYLLREYVWRDLGKHLAVTISLALRGQWVGNYASLIGFILLPACVWILARRGRAGPFLVFCLPPYFMLGLYAFVSVNVVRYNEPLIAVFALSGATVIVHLVTHGVDRLRRMRKQ
jgi:4-amino-4-deoxy-L-arabinose transferase-like glycosyltransferase